MKFFNAEGPMMPDIHYVLPPLARFNQDEVTSLIAARKYFVLHAPRQTGKTTCMMALMKALNESGQYRALYFNVETGQAARENVDAAMGAILSQLAWQAHLQLKDEFPTQNLKAALAPERVFGALHWMLSQWSAADPRPLVVVLDEIDSLIGDTLISVLRQLRSGYPDRPAAFPQCAILCGVRDVQDYRIHSSSTKAVITGGSAFNIKAASWRLGNFTADDIRQLYAQHTVETGQVFDEAIFPLVWELTEGQPWLVNALAYEVCFRMPEGKDRAQTVTCDLIERAKEILILRRDVHLDQLADKLQEDRVRRVIEPILSGTPERETIPPDDLKYTRDLGLVAPSGLPRIANRIYQEVIPRELTWVTQEFMVQETAWYVAADGRLDMSKLLKAFQQYFRENAEAWLERFAYKEAGPHLLLQAFLQRIVNGGGDIRREYGLGRMRTDLLVIWPYAAGTQRVVIELKVARTAPDKLISEGLAQTAEYMDRSDAAEGHLVIFDRRRRKWADKIFRRTRKHQGHSITVWGM